MTDKKKRLTLDDAKKKSPEEQIEKIVKSSTVQFDVAKWFLYKLDFYKWDGDVSKPEGRDMINRVFDENIGIFYEDFTKNIREKYKKQTFEVFKEDTRNILFLKIKKVFLVKDTLLFKEIEKKIISEINFQMGVADYVCDYVLQDIVKKVCRGYEDRIELVKSGTEYSINFEQALEIYFKGYLFANYKNLILVDFSSHVCWYNEGWGIMTWIYKFNGGKRTEENYPITCIRLHDAFCESKNKKEFFKFLKSEKEKEDKLKKRYDTFYEAQEEYLKGAGLNG